MNPYILIAIISCVLFGFTTIMQKKTSGIDSVTFAMISLGASFMSVFIYWFFFSPVKTYNLSGLNYALLAGLLSGFAYLFFIIALRMCKVSTVVIINSFSAAIAVVLSVVLLKEHLTITQIVGVLMGMGGVILVTI
jgi:bacterial/archaeal transporter family protein